MARTRRKRRHAISGRLRTAIFFAAILAVLFAIGIDRHRPEPIAAPGDQSDHATFHGKIFTVSHVVDGDTLDIDHPGPNGRDTRIRLLGVDTPELARDGEPAEPGAVEATRFVTDIAHGVRITVLLDVGGRTRDRYGRLLAYVVLPDGGVVNELLIEHRHSLADRRFPHGYYNKYIQLESSARRRAAD